MNRTLHRSPTVLALAAAAVVAIVAVATPAHAQDGQLGMRGALGDEAPGSRFEVVDRLLNRELPPELREQLEERWRTIEARARRLAELREGLAADDPRSAAIEEAARRLNEQRTTHSGTLMGRNGAVPGTDGRSIGRQNFDRADAMVSEWANAGERLTLDRLLEINRVLGEGLHNNGHQAGTFRGAGHEVAAGGQVRWRYVEGEHVEKAMRSFMRWYERALERGLSPVEIASGVYQRLVSIHPWPDGNGRSSRMAADFVLRSAGLPSVALRSGENLVAIFGQPVLDGGGEPADRLPGRTEGFVSNGLDDTMRELERAAGLPEDIDLERWGREAASRGRGVAGVVRSLAPEVREAARRAFPSVHWMAGNEVTLQVTDKAEPKVTAQIARNGSTVRVSAGMIAELEKAAEGLETAEAERFVRRAVVLQTIAALDRVSSMPLNVERAAEASGVFGERGLESAELTRLKQLYERRGMTFPEELHRKVAERARAPGFRRGTGLLGETSRRNLDRIRDRTSRSRRRAR